MYTIGPINYGPPRNSEDIDRFAMPQGMDGHTENQRHPQYRFLAVSHRLLVRKYFFACDEICSIWLFSTASKLGFENVGFFFLKVRCKPLRNAVVTFGV